jgi:hypothetical protein
MSRQPHEHAETLRVMTRLLGRPGGKLSAGERDYVEVLGRLIDVFGQRKHEFRREKQTPLEILRFLMRESRMNSADLGTARFRVDPGLFF